MKITIKLADDQTGAPVRTMSPDGDIRWDLIVKSCDLVYFEVGTKVTLFEPVALIESVTTEVTGDNRGE
jgi:hypothetical protein